MTENLLPYRPNVGIMVLNQENKVWVGHRLSSGNNEYAGQAQLWQMPQGGVDENENVEAAAYRELYEETGMTSVDLIDRTEDWITYDFPPEAQFRKSGKWQGQKQKWFVFRFIGIDAEIQINPPPLGHEAEFDDWRWEDMARLPDLIVPFKRDVYQQVVDRFSHLVDGDQ